MRKGLIIVLLALSVLPASLVFSQDVGVNLRGPYRDMGRNLIWGQSGVGGFNADFVFTPASPAGSVWVFVKSNNPASAHTFSFQAFETGDPRVGQYLPFSGTLIDRSPWLPSLIVSWPQLDSGGYNPGPSNLNPPPVWNVQASAVVPILVNFRNAARLALNFSGTTAQAGSPDTADIWTVEVPSASPGFVFFDQRSVSANTSPTVAQSYAYTAGVPIWPLASLKSCTLSLMAQNSSGTTPTLNVYFQTGYGITNIVEDLISFTQATTTLSTQVSSVNFEGGVPPKATTNGSLAAGSENSGFGPGDQLLLEYVVTGTSPVYAVNVWGYCH